MPFGKVRENTIFFGTPKFSQALEGVLPLLLFVGFRVAETLSEFARFIAVPSYDVGHSTTLKIPSRDRLESSSINQMPVLECQRGLALGAFSALFRLN